MGIEYEEESEQLDHDDLMEDHDESIEAMMDDDLNEQLGDEVSCKDRQQLRDSVHLQYHELITITRSGDPDNGALLLSFNLSAYPLYNPGQEYWFPKKLCANLDSRKKTIWVWNKFLAREHPNLIKEFSS